MLLSYSFSNFHSFRDEAQVSLTLGQRDMAHGWDRVSPSGKRVTTALAVMGANGAGKTSLVKVGSFLAWFLRDSFNLKPEEEIPVMPHAANLPDSITEISIELDDSSGTVWRYALALNSKRVIYENLHQKGVGERKFQYVFKRETAGGKYIVKQKGFGLGEVEASKVRPNVSLVSWARQYDIDLAVRISQMVVMTNINMLGRNARSDSAVMHAAEFFNERSELIEPLKRLLVSWDLGLSDFEIRAHESHQPDDASKTQKIYYPVGIHKTSDAVFHLPFFYESSGSQTAFVLMRYFLPVLAAGGLAFIDELENDLHPHMIEPILRLFHDPESNPYGAQIVFTCQSPEVLKLLSKAQVVFVEKEDCQSSSFRGDQIEGLRSQDNLYSRYLSGALGAVPSV